MGRPRLLNQKIAEILLHWKRIQENILQPFAKGWILCDAVKLGD